MATDTIAKGAFVRIKCYASPEQANDAATGAMRPTWIPEMMKACGLPGVVVNTFGMPNLCADVSYVVRDNGVNCVVTKKFAFEWIKLIKNPRDEVRADTAKALGHPFDDEDVRLTEMKKGLTAALDKVDEAEKLMTARFAAIREALNSARNSALRAELR